MKKETIIILIYIFVSICYSGYGFAGDPMPVFVSIPPQKQFVQQIGKDLVDVQVMVEPGADPHTYEPKPQQMAALSKAKLYFAIGIEFETAKLDKIVSTNSKLQIIHTDHGIQKIPMDAHHHHEEIEHPETDMHHGHDDLKENHHTEGLLDPHIWLSPPLVMIQARTILKALQEIDPKNSTAYEKNYNTFISDLTKLDQDLKKSFSGKPGLKFMVFHPSWGYFAHAYGLKQIPIEIEGKTPKPSQLKELIEHARENQIRVVFAQPQFSAETAKLIAKEIHGEVLFVDPLAENWSDNLRQVAKQFKTALRP
ncbi:MAG: cation ABC transporter substrate-binding protein [Deltaproteobacteria bacterium]|nr:MAG: cation ABC transporter substrate-binding protein [Deltaproteobacteria bacterium]